MSRASEITMLLILIQASIGFVDSINLFDQHYLNVPSNNASYVITDLNEYTAAQDPGIWDDIALVAGWVVESFMIGIKIIFTVVFVLPTLVLTFHIPVELALFVQVGVYYIYATWFAQWKSGKGWTQYE